ncbi:uncharacterized protein STEHIDRAFT_151488 [Stereum hirsutum FP-91666 SS1]|uniref:uncharacterized protein n=1 Tax=Stereum hirsutum (strain FP-91666) TaxID=721885 RepID=UPI000441045F|nr:uncharacterized protein STEHIDRAFT_151488 [Stereum hirsutum FP-91666 SS1]EIM92145.1 hypothetical protein STEHIDRAFT_151488 [Stereum hirsutum FP-91666 SS1]
MSPPIQLFLTTIASQPALRQRQEYLLRILQAKKIPFKSYDLASDEEAKKLWKRKAPRDKQQLPGILVGNRFPGTFNDFEEAVEYDELTQFLRLKDPWDPALDEDHPQLQEVPIGVPGASSPSQMAKLEHKASFNNTPSPSPLKGKAGRPSLGPHLSPESAAHDPAMQSVVAEIRKRNEEEFDISEELSGYGLQGVKVTHDDLLELVKDLGLDGDDAGDLVKGLSDMTGDSGKKKETKPLAKKATSKVESKSGDGSKVEPLAKKEVTKEEGKKEAGSEIVKVDEPSVKENAPVPSPVAEKEKEKDPEPKAETKEEEKKEPETTAETNEAVKEEEKEEQTGEKKKEEKVEEKEEQTGEKKKEEKVEKKVSGASEKPSAEDKTETDVPEVKVSGTEAEA